MMMVRHTDWGVINILTLYLQGCNKLGCIGQANIGHEYMYGCCCTGSTLVVAVVANNLYWEDQLHLLLFSETFADVIFFLLNSLLGPSGYETKRQKHPRAH